MIRRFEPDDMNGALELLEKLRLDTPYRCLIPDWQRIVNTIIACQNHSTGLVLVAINDGKLTGIMINICRPLWWVEQKLGPQIASDLIFYSQRYGDGRRMLRRMVEWAFTVPRVVRIEMAISSGQGDIPTMRRLYESCGFCLEGTLFVRNHPKYNEALLGVNAA